VTTVIQFIQNVPSAGAETRAPFIAILTTCAACSAAATICPCPLANGNLQAFPLQRYGWSFVTALSGLVTLTFDPLNFATGAECHP